MACVKEQHDFIYMHESIHCFSMQITRLIDWFVCILKLSIDSLIVLLSLCISRFSTAIVSLFRLYSMYEIRLLFYVLDIVGIFLFPNELAFWLIIGTKIEKKILTMCAGFILCRSNRFHYYFFLHHSIRWLGIFVPPFFLTQSSRWTFEKNGYVNVYAFFLLRKTGERRQSPDRLCKYSIGVQ